MNSLQNMQESIKIKKNGVEKEVHVDHQENNFQVNKIAVMVEKNKCYDMF